MRIYDYSKEKREYDDGYGNKFLHLADIEAVVGGIKRKFVAYKSLVGQYANQTFVEEKTNNHATDMMISSTVLTQIPEDRLWSIIVEHLQKAGII
jgi:hypothetical protein